MSSFIEEYHWWNYESQSNTSLLLPTSIKQFLQFFAFVSFAAIITSKYKLF